MECKDVNKVGQEQRFVNTGKNFGRCISLVTVGMLQHESGKFGQMSVYSKHDIGSTDIAPPSHTVHGSL